MPSGNERVTRARIPSGVGGGCSARRISLTSAKEHAQQKNSARSTHSDGKRHVPCWLAWAIYIRRLRLRVEHQHHSSYSCNNCKCGGVPRAAAVVQLSPARRTHLSTLGTGDRPQAERNPAVVGKVRVAIELIALHAPGISPALTKGLLAWRPRCLDAPLHRVWDCYGPFSIVEHHALGVGRGGKLESCGETGLLLQVLCTRRRAVRAINLHAHHALHQARPLPLPGGSQARARVLEIEPARGGEQPHKSRRTGPSRPANAAHASSQHPPPIDRNSESIGTPTRRGSSWLQAGARAPLIAPAQDPKDANEIYV